MCPALGGHSFQAATSSAVGFLPKETQVGFNHLLNILLRGKAEDAIVVTKVITTEEEFERTSPFQLEVVRIHQSVGDCFWILGCDGQIVTVDCNVLIVVPTILHPDVRLCEARGEAHVAKDVSEAFVPA